MAGQRPRLQTVASFHAYLGRFPGDIRTSVYAASPEAVQDGITMLHEGFPFGNWFSIVVVPGTLRQDAEQNVITIARREAA